MNRYESDFIANLIYYRELRGYTQSVLAGLCDRTKGNIGVIESGKSYPSFEMILKIADALQIHPADLFLRNAKKILDSQPFPMYSIYEKEVDMSDAAFADFEHSIEVLTRPQLRKMLALILRRLFTFKSSPTKKTFVRKLGGLEKGFWIADDFDETPDCLSEYT